MASRTTRRIAAMTTAAASLAGAVALAAPASAEPTQFQLNAVGHWCPGDSYYTPGNTCTFDTTSDLGYGGYGPYTIVAKRDGVEVFRFSCQRFIQCQNTPFIPANTTATLTVHYDGFGSLAGGSFS